MPSVLKRPVRVFWRTAVLRHALAIIAGVLCLFCAGTDLVAQTAAPVAAASPDTQERVDSIPTGTSALDAPVSRTDYRLGPGDEVAISIFGSVSHVYATPVTPEGTIVIPNLGVVSVLDLNLDQAESRVREKVLEYYRDVDVRVTLVRLRQIKVFVVGDVGKPGIRVASTATRASELVPAADSSGVAHRNILLQRPSGDTVTLDLLRFRRTGDVRANPRLKEGDVLVVPMVDKTVDVYGRVGFPGRYEYRAGESLAGFLDLVNGARGFPYDAADTIRLTRFVGPKEREIRIFSRAEATGSQGERFTLQPFDAIYVPRLSDFKKQKFAIATGEFARPGTYPITPDSTTVCDLIALAGGFTPQASLAGAVLRRKVNADGASANELQSIPEEYLTEHDKRIRAVIAHGDETNVVLDLQHSCSDGVGPELTLQSGDRLEVPRVQNAVTVLGAVMHPGMVQYAPGQGVGYFVALAGGYSGRADRGEAVVLKAKLGTQVDASEVKSLEPGDQVVIPYKEHRGVLDTFRAANAIISPVVGLLVTVLALTRYF